MSFRDELAALAIDDSVGLETANQRLTEAGFSDGLPLIPPTPSRLAAMLEGWQADGEYVLDLELKPSFSRPSLWEVAANAVLAGCSREYLPVVVAAVAAMCAEEYNLLGVQATTGSAAPLVIVHGPIAHRLGVHGGDNCFGPGNRANATIGRAVSLVLRNLGGAMPGVGDMATLGQPGKYTWCATENSAASPFPPFHTSCGLNPDADAVTVFAASGFTEVVLSGSSAGDYAACFARSLPLRRGPLIVVLPPEPANLFVGKGWDAGRWRDAICERQPEGRGMATPQDLLLMVAGGVGVKAALLPGWGDSLAVTQAIEDL